MPRASARLLLFGSFALTIGSAFPASAQSGLRHDYSTPGAWTSRRAFRHMIASGQVVRWSGEEARHSKWTGHRRRFYPYVLGPWPLLYADALSDSEPTLVEETPLPAQDRALPEIPSVADLPSSTGIRTDPAGRPTVYVLDGAGRSIRTGSAKIVTMNGAESEGDAQPGGPRIIHLDVPVGR